METAGIIGVGVILGLYWDNGKEKGTTTVCLFLMA